MPTPPPGILAPLTLSSSIRRVENLLCCNVRGEAVILDINSGVYFGLNPVGAHVWGLLESPRVISDIVDSIVNEYQVARAQCEDDVLELVLDLISNKLVERSS